MNRVLASLAMLENFFLRGDPVLGMTHGLSVRFWVHPPQPTGRRSQAFLGLPKPTTMHSCALGLPPKLTTASAQWQGLSSPEQPELALHKSDPGQPQHQALSSQEGSGPWRKSISACTQDSVEATDLCPPSKVSRTERGVGPGVPTWSPPGSLRAGRQLGPQRRCSQQHTGDTQRAGPSCLDTDGH